MRRITDALILALAVVAAVVATGLIMGWSMWAWIILYWLVLTAKNVLDWIGMAKFEPKKRKASEKHMPVRLWNGMGWEYLNDDSEDE